MPNVGNDATILALEGEKPAPIASGGNRPFPIWELVKATHRQTPIIPEGIERTAQTCSSTPRARSPVARSSAWTYSRSCSAYAPSEATIASVLKSTTTHSFGVR